MKKGMAVLALALFAVLSVSPGCGLAIRMGSEIGQEIAVKRFSAQNQKRLEAEAGEKADRPPPAAIQAKPK